MAVHPRARLREELRRLAKRFAPGGELNDEAEAHAVAVIDRDGAQTAIDAALELLNGEEPDDARAFASCVCRVVAQAAEHRIQPHGWKLEHYLRRAGIRFEGGRGQWRICIAEQVITVLCDVEADRMRFMAPVADADDVGEGELRELLLANFDRALDAKYALWHDAVWSTYMHPLASLTFDEFTSGLEQVLALAQNYGTSYASTDLYFATTGEDEDGDGEHGSGDGRGSGESGGGSLVN